MIVRGYGVAGMCSDSIVPQAYSMSFKKNHIGYFGRLLGYNAMSIGSLYVVEALCSPLLLPYIL
jgi:hypothetical protein